MENYRFYDYDGRPLEDGEVLVLMPYDEDDVKANCKNPKSVVTVSKGGRRVKGVWKAIPREWEKEARAQFNEWARDQLPPPTEGRCLVPQPDGTTKPCPKKNGNNRCSCAQCPHRGEYDREVIALASIDQMHDEFGYDPIPGDTSPEIKFFDAIEEQDGLARINGTLQRLTEISPKLGLAAKLMARGVRGEEFAKALGLGHQCANRVRQQVLDLAADGITSFDQMNLSAIKVNRSKLDDDYRRKAQSFPDFQD